MSTQRTLARSFRPGRRLRRSSPWRRSRSRSWPSPASPRRRGTKPPLRQLEPDRRPGPTRTSRPRSLSKTRANPEAAKDISANLPDRSVRQPGRDRQMRRLRIRPQRMPGRLPGGPDHARTPTTRRTRTTCSALRRSTTWSRSAKTRPRGSPSSRPRLNIPIAIPVTVRTGSDYGLRMTVTGITQLIPLSHATSRSGACRRCPHTTASASRKDRPATRPAAPAWSNRAAPLARRIASGLLLTRYIDNPSICTGQRTAGRAGSRRPTRTRTTRARPEHLSGHDRLRETDVQTGLQHRR